MSDLIPGEGFRFRRVTGEVFPSCVLVDAPGGGPVCTLSFSIKLLVSLSDNLQECGMHNKYGPSGFVTRKG